MDVLVSESCLTSLFPNLASGPSWGAGRAGQPFTRHVVSSHCRLPKRMISPGRYSVTNDRISAKHYKSNCLMVWYVPLYA